MDVPKHTDLKKGYATHLLLAIIALVLFPIVAMYLISTLGSIESVRIGVANRINYMNLYNRERIAVEQVLDRINLTNVGFKPVSIQFVAIRSDSGVSLYRVEYLSNKCAILKPAESCSFQLNQSAVVIAIVTTSGVVIKPRVLASNIAIVPTIEMYTSSLQNLSLAQDLVRLFNVSPDLVRLPYPCYVYRGTAKGIEGRWIYILNKNLGLSSKEQKHIRIKTGDESNNRIPFGIAVIGYDPTWLSEPDEEPRFRILLTGHFLLRKCGENSLCIVEDRSNAPRFLRLKLYNFSGEIRIYQDGELIACAPYPSCAFNSKNVRNAIGFWYYGYDIGLEIYIDGTITALREYVAKERGKATSHTTSYDPYLFIADTDGNNLTELILITEDAWYGNAESVDDRFELRKGRKLINLVTKSTEPLTLILNLSTVTGENDGSIPGDKYSGLYLYLNMYFHDNSYPDSQQLEDNPDTLPVLQIVLIDQSGHEYIVREYEYQEIANYHQTLIEDLKDGETKYFTKLSQMIYVPIPQKGKYWLAIKLQDPYYHEECGINDADFTIGLEYIGVILVLRR